MSRIVITLIALLLVFMAASPLAAIPPVESSGSWANDFYLFTCEDQGFHVHDNVVGRFSETRHYDHAGALVKLRGRAYGVDTLHYKDDYSKVITSKFSHEYEWNAIAQEMKFAGTAFSVQLPPQALVVRDVGQGSFDGDTDALIKRAAVRHMRKAMVCNYLAP
jgi:hypothetical protein